MASARGDSTALLQRVRRAVRGPARIPPGASVLIGCSGGPDSTALALALHQLAPAMRWRLVLAHLTHEGLRGEQAEQDRDFVQALARKLELEVVTSGVNVPALAAARRCSLEEAGRHARYAFFETGARSCRCGFVALGHQRDDQVETVLFRILRGTGVAGLAGIPARRPLSSAPDTPIVVRPLLAIPRAELEAFLAAAGISARLDRTNLDPAAASRNRIRLVLLPALRRLWPKADRSLLALAAAAQRAREAIEAALEPRLQHALAEASPPAAPDTRTRSATRRRTPGHPTRTPADRPPRCGEQLPASPPAAAHETLLSLPRTTIAATPPELRSFLIREAVRRSSGLQLLERHTQALLHLVEHDTGEVLLHLPHGLQARREYDLLLLERTAAPGGTTGHRQATRTATPVPSPPPRRLAVPGLTVAPEYGVRVEIARAERGLPPAAQRRRAPNCAWLDADALTGQPLVLRHPRPGDRMRPTGLQGTKKLHDIFVDAKVPRQLRQRALVLASGDTIACVLGLRADERLAASPTSRAVLCVRAEPLTLETETDPEQP